MKIFMKSQFDAYSGYGWDACDIAVGLEALGHDVVIWPTSVMPGLPPAVSRLLSKNPAGPYDIAFGFCPPFDLKPDGLVRFAPKAVGWSMWESSAITIEDMLGHGWGDLAVGQPRKEVSQIRETEYIDKWWSWSRHAKVDHKGLDSLLVTCQMNVDAFRAADPVVPIDVLACGIDPERFPFVERPVDRRMRFGMIGMLMGRKDPFLMLEAWRELKAERPDFDAVLEMKTACAGLHPDLVNVYKDVVIHDRSWPMEKVVEWYGQIDVLVSVSRGEGNNKPAMEFMSTGGTVIASDWGGHQNWLIEEAGYPLSGVLMPVHAGRSDVLDFRADKEHLKRLLIECWEDRETVRRKSEYAAKYIRQALSWDAVCLKLSQHFDRVIAS